MAKICIIGKKGSASKIEISRNTSVKLYRGQEADAVVNYGLAGDKLSSFIKTYPKLNKVPIINKYVGRSKYSSIKNAESKGILVPESKVYLDRLDTLDDWIEKKINSSQGKGIIKARTGHGISGKYYQKLVKSRKYELRVHAFAWLPIENWSVQKRIGPANQITWNYHTGGHFKNLNNPDKFDVFKKAKEVSEEVLKLHNMSFGAVDFIVTDDLKVYFIEINSSPGFSNLSGKIYFKAMEELTKLSSKELTDLGE